MKNHRISTSISQKHWEILKRYAEKHETQQKVLELALESLDSIESMKEISKSNRSLTVEEEYWLRAKSLKSICLIPKDVFGFYTNTADIEQYKEFLTQSSSLTFGLEYLLQKPIKECSLKEVIDTLVIILRIGNAFDTVDCKEDSNLYLLILTHSFGIKGSKMACIAYEIIFKSYGAKVESIISDKTIFMKIYKKDKE